MTAESLPITNLAAPSNANDAARKADVDAVALTTGNLPDVTANQVNSFLVAGSGGTWTVKNLRDTKTVLSLGTAASADTGTDANDVPTITDADARYLVEANNLSDLVSASNARDNLGLGTAAVLAANNSANNLIKLASDGSLPALDGAALTNLSTQTNRVMGFGEYQLTTGGALSTSYAKLGLDGTATSIIDSDGVTLDTPSSDDFQLSASSRYILDISIIIHNANAAAQTFNIELYDETGAASIWQSPNITALAGGDMQFTRAHARITVGANSFSWRAQASVGTDLTVIAGTFTATKIS